MLHKEFSTRKLLWTETALLCCLCRRKIVICNHICGMLGFWEMKKYCWKLNKIFLEKWDWQSGFNKLFKMIHSWHFVKLIFEPSGVKLGEAQQDTVTAVKIIAKAVFWVFCDPYQVCIHKRFCSWLNTNILFLQTLLNIVLVKNKIFLFHILNLLLQCSYFWIHSYKLSWLNLFSAINWISGLNEFEKAINSSF